MKKEKIPKIYTKIQDMPQFLKSVGVDISYRGLRHYINLGLIPKPMKFAGHKEKYYDPVTIADRLMGIKYCSAFFHMNHNEIKGIFSELPEISEKLPGIFILAYGELAYKMNKKERRVFSNAQVVNTAASFFVNAVKKIFRKSQKNKSITWSKLFEEISDVFQHDFSKWFKVIYKGYRNRYEKRK